MQKAKEGIWYFQTANNALSVPLLFHVTVCSYLKKKERKKDRKVCF